MTTRIHLPVAVIAPLLVLLSTLPLLSACGDNRTWVALEGHPTDNPIVGMYSTRNGTFVIGIDGEGIFYRDEGNNAWVQMRVPSGHRPRQFGWEGFFDHDGRLVFCMDEGQFFRVDTDPGDGGTWVAEAIGQPLGHSNNWKVGAAADGTLVAAEYYDRQTLAWLAPGDSEWTIQQHDPTGTVNGLALARDGELYLGENSVGLFRVVLGTELTLEPAYDCDTPEWDHCQDLFTGTVLDGDGNLLETQGHNVRRYNVQTGAVSLIYKNKEQNIARIFPGRGSKVYLNTRYNLEAARVYELSTGGSADLIVGGIAPDRQVFATTNGNVYQLINPPQYQSSGVLGYR